MRRSFITRAVCAGSCAKNLFVCKSSSRLCLYIFKPLASSGYFSHARQNLSLRGNTEVQLFRTIARARPLTCTCVDTLARDLTLALLRPRPQMLTNSLAHAS